MTTHNGMCERNKSKNNNEGDEVIEVRKKEEFSIVLDSNPTTGYRWEANFDSEIIKLIRKEFTQLRDGIGAKGKERFDFMALSEKETCITMVYKRQWEDKTINTKLFTIKVR